jgi:hypothetical protein
MKLTTSTLQKTKKILMHSLSALVVGVICVFMLSSTSIQVSASFGDGLQNPAGEGSLLQQVGGGELDVSTGDNALTGLELFISRIIGFLTVLAGIFFVVYFILGALSWITAGGDTSKIQKARDQIVQGVIGLIVIVGAYAVVGIIGSVVGINILNPAAQLRIIFPI